MFVDGTLEVFLQFCCLPSFVPEIIDYVLKDPFN